MALRKSSVFLQYRDLARKLAWQYWKTLPLAAKMWVDPEDMVAESYLHLMRVVVKNKIETRRYKQELSSLTTFVYWTIDHHLLNFAIAQQTGKRFGYRADLEAAAPIHVEEKLFSLFEAKEALEAVYRRASPALKDEIALWFGAERKTPRWGLDGRAMIQEFAGLAQKYRLTQNDCALLLRSGVWCPQ